ncbi:hypothetical protein J7T55_004482 [Diaporthe amygdali]|uniref:uncharacterized protein n=1 Tax=Phomopsis amygdali TaxID=1214568 RepID=UPI0022FE63B5|nr:uncharacterized protein J7T55_004482 [Diaporthe amygdali]KAJ0114741.1 hypothetical protein J7T55_004482 [Diaporthe amygdali]
MEEAHQPAQRLFQSYLVRVHPSQASQTLYERLNCSDVEFVIMLMHGRASHKALSSSFCTLVASAALDLDDEPRDEVITSHSKALMLESCTDEARPAMILHSMTTMRAQQMQRLFGGLVSTLSKLRQIA